MAHIAVSHFSSYWCRLPESNWLPDDYKSTALPSELSRRKSFQDFLQFVCFATNLEEQNYRLLYDF